MLDRLRTWLFKKVFFKTVNLDTTGNVVLSQGSVINGNLVIAGDGIKLIVEKDVTINGQLFVEGNGFEFTDCKEGAMGPCIIDNKGGE